MSDTENWELDLIWGIGNIARALGRKDRVVGYMLENGQLPGAKKVYGRWCVSRKKLLQFFEVDAA